MVSGCCPWEEAVELHTESVTLGSERPQSGSQRHPFLVRLWAGHTSLRASLSCLCDGHDPDVILRLIVRIQGDKGESCWH